MFKIILICACVANLYAIDYQFVIRRNVQDKYQGYQGDRTFDEIEFLQFENITSQQEFEDFLTNWSISVTPKPGYLYNYEDKVGSVNAISFQNCSLEKIPKIFFSTFWNVKILEMESVGIKTLDKSDFEFARFLMYLNLAKNKITKLDEELFSRNDMLIGLDFSRNEISSIHDQAFQMTSDNFTTLDLSSNPIKLNGNKFLQKLKVAKSFKRLIASSISLSSLSVDLFVELEALEELHLTRNKISGLEYGVFSNQQNLKVLNFSNNAFSRIDFNILSSLSTLETLDLSFNKFIYVKEYQRLKQFFPNLKYIGLEGNEMACDYLAEVKINLKLQGITIIRPNNPVRNRKNYMGIAC